MSSQSTFKKGRFTVTEGGCLPVIGEEPVGPACHPPTPPSRNVTKRGRFKVITSCLAGSCMAPAVKYDAAALEPLVMDAGIDDSTTTDQCSKYDVGPKGAKVCRMQSPCSKALLKACKKAARNTLPRSINAGDSRWGATACAGCVTTVADGLSSSDTCSSRGSCDSNSSLCKSGGTVCAASRPSSDSISATIASTSERCCGKQADVGSSLAAPLTPQPQPVHPWPRKLSHQQQQQQQSTAHLQGQNGLPLVCNASDVPRNVMRSYQRGRFVVEEALLQLPPLDCGRELWHGQAGISTPQDSSPCDLILLSSNAISRCISSPASFTDAVKQHNTQCHTPKLMAATAVAGCGRQASEGGFSVASASASSDCLLTLSPDSGGSVQDSSEDRVALRRPHTVSYCRRGRFLIQTRS